MIDNPDLYGWLGGALLVARIIPQIARIRRTGSYAGVSRAGLWCWLGNDIGWLSYGHSSGLTPLVASSAALTVLDLILLAQTRSGARAANEKLGKLWAALMTALAAAGSPALPAALIAASFSGTVPHAISSIRSSDLSGISPATWLLAGLDGILWLIYGAGTGDRPVTLYAALTLATSATILTRIHLWRRKTTPLPQAQDA